MTLKKIVAGTLLVLVATFSWPAAAAAGSFERHPECSVSPARIDPGESGTFACAAGTFEPGESVRFTVSGTNGDTVTIAALRAADVVLHASSATTLKRARLDGGTSIRVRVPEDGGGTYSLTASGASRTVTSSLSVPPADGTVASSNSASGTDLAATGSRADSVFGWVVAIIAAFAALGFVSRGGRARL